MFRRTSVSSTDRDYKKMSKSSHSEAKRLLLIVAFVLLVATTARAREFRAAETQSEDYPTVRAVVKMGELIEARTGGRHRIRVFHTRQLGEEKEKNEKNRGGGVEIQR